MPTAVAPVAIVPVLPVAAATAAAEPTYQIPAAYRRMENLHILFWLLKDIAWCMIWRPLGISMIFPTLSIALIITRRMASELAHNLAIVFWISANSYWSQ